MWKRFSAFDFPQVRINIPFTNMTHLFKSANVTERWHWPAPYRILINIFGSISGNIASNTRVKVFSSLISWLFCVLLLHQAKYYCIICDNNLDGKYVGISPHLSYLCCISTHIAWIMWHLQSMICHFILGVLRGWTSKILLR